MTNRGGAYDYSEVHLEDHDKPGFGSLARTVLLQSTTLSLLTAILDLTGSHMTNEGGAWRIT